MTARLMFYSGNGTIRPVRVDDTVRIGSAPEIELTLADEDIASLHARVTLNDGRYRIEDAGSRQGTFVNGERVSQAWLRNLDVVTIGSHHIVFLQGIMPPESVAVAPAVEAPDVNTLLGAFLPVGMPANLMQAVDVDGDQPAGTIIGLREVGPIPRFSQTIIEQPSSTGSSPNPSARPLPEAGPSVPPVPHVPGVAAKRPIVRVRLSGSMGTFELPLGRSTIGRGAEATVRIDSKEISRVHAVVLVIPADVTVADQQSANGTSVNGKPTTGARRLVDGDRVSFGRIEFRVECVRLDGDE